MAYESSLSFHNDVTWNIEHDERTSERLPNNVNSEDCKYNIYWEGNTTVEKFYDKYFEPEFQKFQKRKSKKDRFDGTYLEMLSKEQAEKEKKVRDLRSQNAPYKAIRDANRFRKVAYQVVVTLGNCEDNPEFKHGGSREHETIAILSEYMNTFEERNPGLKLICGAIHCDEGDRFDEDGNLTKVGGNIHLHLTYCPVAECEIGAKYQNSLNGAYKMMDIDTAKAFDPITKRWMTGQIRWQDREREHLSSLAKEYGIDIISKGKGKDVHLAVDDYQRKKEIDYVNESKKQLSEREKDLERRQQTFNEMLKDFPSVKEQEEIVAENVDLFQRNDELEKRENSTQDIIQSIREDYFSESADLWDKRKKEKEELKALIKDATANKRFDEKRYNQLMNSIFHTNENILKKLLKFIFSLFLRYKLKKEEAELQRLTEENEKMKAKSKEIVEAGKELTAALKTKNAQEILNAIDNWDYAVNSIENSICHKIDIDFENERLKREKYEERLSRREQQEGEARNNKHIDFDELR